MTRKIVVFAPHPDDETLGCGGTMVMKMSEGCEVLIVVMTDGKNAFTKVLGIYSDPTPEEVKRIRKKEIRMATKSLGVPEENLFFLDFEDGKLGDSEIAAEEKIAAILSENSPAEIFFTYSKDCNPDHVATNRIVNKAIEKLNLPVTKYQYSIAQSNSRVAQIVDPLVNFIKHNMIYVDISRFLNLKKAALKEYKSQIAIISSKQKEPILSRKFLEMHLRREEIFYKG